MILIIAIGFFAVTISGGFQGRIHDFSLKNLDNRESYYSDLKGKSLTVIDFWATWCQPCVRSLPTLAALQDEFKDQGVVFIGISVDGPRNLAKVKPFTRSIGITYPVLLDPNAELMGDLNVFAVPTLLIINSDDEIVYIHEGFHTGDENLIREKILEKLNADK